MVECGERWRSVAFKHAGVAGANGSVAGVAGASGSALAPTLHQPKQC